MPNDPRPFTVEEMRAKFFDWLRGAVDYWATINTADSPHTVHDRLSGLAHTFMAGLSGRSMGMPGFDLVPSPADEDEAYLRERGENWWAKRDINDGNLNYHLYNDHNGRKWRDHWEANREVEPEPSWHRFTREGLRLGLLLISSNGYHYWMDGNDIRTDNPERELFQGSGAMPLVREINMGATFTTESRRELR